jgi:hypothetical protein
MDKVSVAFVVRAREAQIRRDLLFIYSPRSLTSSRARVRHLRQMSGAA